MNTYKPAIYSDGDFRIFRTYPERSSIGGNSVPSFPHQVNPSCLAHCYKIL